jgi:hypothetical protein
MLSASGRVELDGKNGRARDADQRLPRRRPRAPQIAHPARHDDQRLRDFTPGEVGGSIAGTSISFAD